MGRRNRARPRLLLVDGYNYVHRCRQLRAGAAGGEREAARSWLALRLRALGGAGGVTIVWDTSGLPPGAPGGGAAGGVRHLFAAGAASADEKILEILRQADEPESYCVVTDDRELAGKAARLGAKRLGVAALEEKLERGTARPAPGPRPRREAARPASLRELWPGKG